MKHLLIMIAVLSTGSAFAGPPTGVEPAASAPETFEQMCTKRATGYGRVVSKERLADKPDGLKLELVEDGRKKTVECFVNDRGVLTFNVKDVKKKSK